MNKSKAIGFEDLEVFKLVYRVSLDIHRASLNFPQIEQFALGDQVRRASKSVCANIAEGFGKQLYSTAEFKRFLTIAIGSCDEMRVWVRYCFDLGYVSEEIWRDWRDKYQLAARMLVTLRSQVTKRQLTDI